MNVNSVFLTGADENFFEFSGLNTALGVQGNVASDSFSIDTGPFSGNEGILQSLISGQLANVGLVGGNLAFPVALSSGTVGFGPGEKFFNGLDARLNSIFDTFETNLALGLETSFAAEKAAGILDDVKQVGDYVVVDVTAVGGDSAALLAELQDMGLLRGAAFGSMVSGLMPVAQLGELSIAEHVRFASASLMGTNAGSVTNQGDASMLADVARLAFNVDGTGISIGVLSDSYDDLEGAAADILTGDLPDGITVLEDLNGSGSDEGRAMLQLIHDTAPGADLLFHTAFLGQANFAQGIIDLQNAGSDIIVDDVFYFAEPFFQDGIIAQAVDTVVANGAMYFSSAGNSHRDSYESDFRVSAETVTGITGVLHDFDPGEGDDARMSVTLADGDEISLSLQWDQPFSAAGGAGATSDIDIFLVDPVTNNLVAFGFSDNIASGNAVETLSFTNETGESQTYDIVISVFDGPNPGVLKFIDFDGAATYNEYFTNSSTVVGHSNAVGTHAIGASAFFFTPEFGQDPPVLNSFSSFGVTPIYFDTAGNLLASPEIRDGVIFTAPDGGNTTFFGSDSGADADDFPNFFGTSAAAPNAAAAAALMMQAVPEATRDQITQALVETALDILQTSNGVGLDVGNDIASGAGLIQVSDAIVRLQEIVAAGNQSPVAQDDAVSTDEDNALSGDVLADNGNGVDSDGDGDTLTVTAVNGESTDIGSQITLASGALLTLNSDGTFSYDPNAQFETLAVSETATDSFTYTLSDGNEGTDTATVTVTINGVNDDPTAVADVLAVEDTASDTAGTNLLSNDSDVDASDTLTVSAVNGDAGNVGGQITLASGALLTVSSNGDWSYDPNGQFGDIAEGSSDTDSFTYTVSDGNGGTATETVTITINNPVPPNQSPVAQDDAVSTDEDNALSGDVLADNGNGVDSDGDGDTLTVTAVNGESTDIGSQITLASGALLTLNSDGTFSYDPNAQFETLAVSETATDSFTYTLSDGNEGTDTATVTVTINGVNDDPTAVADTLEVEDTASDTAGTNLLSNDSDVDASDTLTVSAVNGDAGNVGGQITLASGALLTVSSNGDWSYDPNGQFGDIAEGSSDTDSFTYTVSDGNGGTATETVTITINNPVPPNQSPVAQDDAVSTDEDNALSGDVLADNGNGVDSDGDGDTLTVTAVNGESTDIGSQITLASGALLTLNSDGTFSYDPNAQFETLAVSETATDSFTYTLSDGNEGTDTATVTVTINGVNDDPTAVADTLAVEDTASDTAGTNLLSNDSDVDASDTLTVSAVNGDAGNVGGQITLASGALLTVSSNGDWSYDPNGQFGDIAEGSSDADSFTYTVSDGNGGTATETVTITINNPAIVLQANDDTLTVFEDDEAVDGPSLIDNDTGNGTLLISEVDGAAASVGTEIALASGALLLVNSDGTFSYDANGQFESLAAGETATDSFEYTLTDDDLGAETATVTITITGENDVPGAIEDTLTVTEDDGETSGTGLLANDVDPDASDVLNVTAVNGLAENLNTQITLASGALLTANADGSWSYDANGAFESLAVNESATDSFNYTVEDGNGGTDTGIATISISGVNDDPVAVLDTLVVDRDAGFIFGDNLLLNDSDPDVSDTLFISAVNGEAGNVGVPTSPASGSILSFTPLTLASGAFVAVTAAGDWIYDANNQFSSLTEGQTTEDSFTYTVSDGNGGTAQETVTITITGNDKNQITGTDAGETLDGTEEGDEINGQAGDDMLNGLGGDDRLFGGFDRDHLLGGAGNDALFGNAGFDLLEGGDGNDTLRGGAQADNLLGGAGDDLLLGEGGLDRAFGGAGNDLMIGGEGDIRDVFFGDTGNDTGYGGAGDDFLVGGAGFDTLYGEDGDDRLEGRFNIDFLFGGAGADRLFGGDGADQHFGGSGDDLFYGGGGDDLLEGGDGDDVIFANAGFDRIIGGAGNDQLSGNFNADTFVFADGFGEDEITDFEATNDFEKIDLSAVTNITDFADLQAEHLDTSTGTVRIIDGANIITLTGVDVNDLDASDFIF